MHTKVGVRVEVAVVQVTSLTPVPLGFILLAVEKSNDTFLVVDVGFLPNKGNLHSVEVLLKVLLVLPDQRLSNLRQFPFALRNLVYLNALDQYLNQRRAFRELRPGKREAVKSDRHVFLTVAADHEFENADAKRVDVLQHQNLHLLKWRASFLLLRKGPVAGFRAQRHIHRGFWGEVGDFEHAISFVVYLMHHLAQVELPVHQSCGVCILHASRKLDCHVVDQLPIAGRHI